MSRWFKQAMIGLLGIVSLASCQSSESPKKSTSAATLPCYQRTATNCSTYSVTYTCSWNGTSCTSNYGTNWSTDWSGQQTGVANCAQYTTNPTYCTGQCQMINGQCTASYNTGGAASNCAQYTSNPTYCTGQCQYINGQCTAAYNTGAVNNCAQYTTNPTYCTGQCQFINGQCQSLYGTTNQWSTGAWNTTGVNTGTGWYNQNPTYQTTQQNLGGMMAIAGGLGAVSSLLSGGGLSGAMQGAITGMQTQLSATNSMGGGYPNGMIGTTYYPQTGVYPNGTYYPQTYP